MGTVLAVVLGAGAVLGSLLYYLHRSAENAVMVGERDRALRLATARIAAREAQDQSERDRRAQELLAKADQISRDGNAAGAAQLLNAATRDP